MQRLPIAQTLGSIATVALLTLAPGCGDDAGSEEGTTGDSGSETTGGDATVTVTGLLTVYPAGTVVADAEVCWLSGDTAAPCTTSDASGAFALEAVPAQTQGALRFLDDQLVPFAYLLKTADEDIDIGTGFGIDSPEVHADYFPQTGVTAIDGRVAVFAQLQFDGPRGGYTMSLTPSSGEGPFYYGATPGELDPSATATSGFGVGASLNVDPADGPFDLSFAQDGTNCTVPSIGAPLDSWNVPAGVESVFVGLRCE